MELHCHTLREWQQLYKKEASLIVQASVIDGSDSWQPFPIGMCWQYILNAHKGKTIQVGQHDKTLLAAITPNTDQRRRPTGINRVKIIENLQKNGIKNGLIDHHVYFNTLPMYKFIVSPEGNGIDCHRHYEALMAGCIPIIERNPLIEEKYKGCPILYTTDYSEITEEYLNTKYAEMLNTKYDFSRLFLTSYTEEQINTIKRCGNYWLYRTTGKTWY